MYLLVEDYGRDKFLTLYRMKGSLAASVLEVYRVSFADLEQLWRKRIESLIGVLPVIDSLTIAVRAEDHGASIQQVDRILAGYGRTAELMGAKGQFLMSIGRYDDAIETLKALFATKSCAIEPPYIFQGAHYVMGKCYAALGEKEKAVPHLEEAIRIDELSRATADADSLLSSLAD